MSSFSSIASLLPPLPPSTPNAHDSDHNDGNDGDNNSSSNLNISQSAFRSTNGLNAQGLNVSSSTPRFSFELEQVFALTSSVDDEKRSDAYRRLRSWTRNLGSVDRMTAVQMGILDVISKGLVSGSVTIKADAAWGLANLVFDPSFQYADGDVAREAVRALSGPIASNLSPLLSLPNDAVQQAAARAVWVISDCGKTTHSLVRAGVIHPLANMLSSPNMDLAANAAGALTSLAYDAAARVEIVRAGAIFALGRLLSNSGNSACLHAVYLLGSLLSESPLEDGGIELSAQHTCYQALEANIIEPLVSLLSATEPKLVLKTVGVMVNLGQFDDIRECVVDAGAIESMIEINKAVSMKPIKHQEVVALALAVLAGPDELNEHCSGNPSLINTVTEVLRCCVLGEKYDGVYYTMWMVCQCVSRLAANDHNVLPLLHVGAMDLLIAVITRIDVAESDGIPGPVIDEATRFSLCALLHMCFNAEARSAMVKNPNAVAAIDRLRATGSGSVAVECSGLLWLVGVLAMPACPDAALSSTASQQQNNPTSSPSVCIHYHTNAASEGRRLSGVLETYGVYLCEESPMIYRHGGCSSATIRQAQVVIFLLTPNFEGSAALRAGAVYASSLNKRIIPVTLHPTYAPKGWLRRLLGDRPVSSYVCIGERADQTTAFDALHRLIIGATVSSSTSLVTTSKTPMSLPPPPPPLSSTPSSSFVSAVQQQLFQTPSKAQGDDGNHLDPNHAITVPSAAKYNSINHSPVANANGNPSSMALGTNPDVSAWTVRDVGLWLNSLGMGGSKEVFAAQMVAGVGLIELASLEQRNPQFFHVTTKSELQMLRFGDRLAFAAALKQLMNQYQNFQKTTQAASSTRKTATNREFV